MKQALSVSNKEIVSLVENGGVLSPKGYKAGAVHAGLRYNRLDIGVLISETPASCAAVYTTSHFQAAPLKVTQESIANEGKIQAVIVNSACANACTGEQGLKDAYKMRTLTSEKFHVREDYIAVASTGVIGEYLPMDKIESGINSLEPGKGGENAEDFQKAILTTDTVMKSSCYQAEIGGKSVHVGGAAKGSGMIHPNMATMLGFLTTDAAISPEHLSAALKEVTDITFNQITVDGDTSTNDMVIVMANGQAGNEPLTPDHSDWPVFVKLLKENCESLAKQIARDGEGATKLIEVAVNGAVSNDEARTIAKQIVGSNLVKTAVYGADANWGRIIGAVGQANASVNPETVDIELGPIVMLKGSNPVAFSEEEAKAYLEKDTIHIMVDLNMGDGSGTAWGCDLSYDYVKINASYRT
ncbi:bifunctional ornithine acetyltransferase/N-acetylglutamate synthase [Mesobacillus foraminis]|uniref:bifunctional ornithine acetyltransferase/N-acetylglutamate synthase n=1 Tax=Mesobacillus foraminis TaxID=279826 RepID=UPI001BE55E1F|nr:bifunctional ornithine acetyltransferase/N-acetylglutamate synthase [Mesobacillus foraminis]MBT2756407.1 bifunctional ornithine acetyltransferase/N-acetylglutamate synthase [Mesobacillus foraminis]